MYARTTSIRGTSEAIDDATARACDDEVMPAVERMDDVIGLSFLADRDSGRCSVATAWQTEEAMRATLEEVGTMRDRVGKSPTAGRRFRPGDGRSPPGA
jgi:hypothetical protein